MCTNESRFCQLVALLVFVSVVSSAVAETLYIDAKTGSDTNPGTSEEPLKTFHQAAKLVNGAAKPGPTTIKISPGIYNLTSCVIFKNTRSYTED